MTPPSGAGSSGPSVTVALTDSVDAYHAPVPTNDAERLVFAGLYETLVRFDCDGNALPGLAASWASSDGGRRWTLTLRSDARFWDGSPVTARDVAVGKSGAGFTLNPVGEHTVVVLLARPSRTVPLFLADPALAVTKPAPDRGWPIGTGRFWVTGATAFPESIRAHSVAGDTVTFRLPAEGDVRDRLDGGVDLLVTRDRAVLDYAAGQPRFVVADLPWDRTYVLAGAAAPAARLEGLEQAVRTDARLSEEPYWWERLDVCALSAPPGTETPRTPTRRIVFRRGDAVARDLAGRIAALTRGTTLGMGPADFARALAAGNDAGYVLALPRRVADPCRAAGDVLPRSAGTRVLTPLIDVRPRVVSRRGSREWVVDWDGTLRLR